MTEDKDLKQEIEKIARDNGITYSQAAKLYVKDNPQEDAVVIDRISKSVEDNQEELHEEIQKYMKEKECSYGEAYKAVSKKHRDPLKEGTSWPGAKNI